MRGLSTAKNAFEYRAIKRAISVRSSNRHMDVHSSCREHGPATHILKSEHAYRRKFAIRLISSGSGGSSGVEDSMLKRLQGDEKSTVSLKVGNVLNEYAQDEEDKEVEEQDSADQENDQYILECEERPSSISVGRHMPPQHSQKGEMHEHYANLISVYLDPSIQSKDITDQDAREIKACISFLESRVKERSRSIEDVERDFNDAATLEQLLYILLNSSSQQATTDSDTMHATVTDFNKALTAWRYASLGIRHHGRPIAKTRQYFEQNSAQWQRFEQNFVQWQRRNACRCLHASERSQTLLDKMEDLAANGCPLLRPTQYSYESVIGSWSVSSGALNYMLRGEGKVLGMWGKIPPRSDFLGKTELAKNPSPWDDPSVLERYGLMDPAKKADDMLERLFTMEELDEEFQVSPWVMKQTITSWVQVKTKPRRFKYIGEKTSEQLDESIDSYEFDEEYRGM